MPYSVKLNVLVGEENFFVRGEVYREPTYGTTIAIDVDNIYDESCLLFEYAEEEPIVDRLSKGFIVASVALLGDSENDLHRSDGTPVPPEEVLRVIREAFVKAGFTIVDNEGNPLP